MEHRKKLTTVEAEFEKMLDDFAQCVVSQEKALYHSDLEPFESYAVKLKALLKHNVKEFRVKFMRGYTLLLEEQKYQTKK